MERVRPGKRGAHPAITEFNQEDFEMFFRLVRRPETSVRPQPPSPRSPQFPVASCLVKIHSSHRKTGFLRAHGPSESATSECKRGCGRTMYFKICGIGRVASRPMRCIETFPSKQMYLYPSLVERKVTEFYHNIDRRRYLVWFK